MLELTLGQARRLHLAAQGLLRPSRRRARKSDLVATIRRLALLQIDTIHIVSRSPYLVLHSRLGDYSRDWLDEALAAGQIGECWAHEACFVPAEDLPLHRRHMNERSGHWAHRMAQRSAQSDAEGMAAVEARIAAAGACRSVDFTDTGPGQGGWWGWKSEKRWLEALFHLGRVMVARRRAFQRVYDLPERVLRDSALLDGWRNPPPADHVRSRFIEDAVRALGVARPAWLADYHRLQPRVDEGELRERLAERLLEVRVQGLEGPCFVHIDHREALQQVAAGGLRATHCSLLSPFDPVVWDRRRARELFDFDYRLECYVPAEKRIWGYFVLPVLLASRLIGRLDAKAHRSDGVMEVRSLHVEAGSRPAASSVRLLAGTLQRFADWHQTPRVELTEVADRHWRQALQAALANAEP